jgi:hypothetical protein
MKYAAFAFLLPLLLSLQASAQKGDEVNFTDAIQLDSSEYFLIPKLLDDNAPSVYGKGKGYVMWGNYSDIFFYNSATGTTKKLFGPTLSLIVPFHPRVYYGYGVKPPDTPPNFLPRHIVYLARTENFNGDNALDSDDPVYLYLSTRSGEQLKQITPKGMNVLSWIISRDKKFLLVKVQQDKNGNKKFGNGDDELYYRVDLADDIAQVKCYQIVL